MYILFINKCSTVLTLLFVFSNLQSQTKVYCRQNQQSVIKDDKFTYLINPSAEKEQFEKIFQAPWKSHSVDERTEKLLDYIFSFDTSLTESYVHKNLSEYIPYFYHSKNAHRKNSEYDYKTYKLSINIDNQIWTPYRNEFELPSYNLKNYIGIDFQKDTIAALIARIGGEIGRDGNYPYNYWFKIRDSIFTEHLKENISDSIRVKYHFLLCLVLRNIKESNIQANFFRRINNIDSILMRSKNISSEDKIKWYIALYKIIKRDKIIGVHDYLLYLMKAQHIYYTNYVSNDTYSKLKNIIENEPMNNKEFLLAYDSTENLYRSLYNKNALDEIIIVLNKILDKKEQFNNVETIIQQKHDNSVLCWFTIIKDYFDVNKKLYKSESYFQYIKLLQRYFSFHKISISRKYHIDVQVINQIYIGIDNSTFICSKNNISNSITEMVSTLMIMEKYSETDKWIHFLQMMHNVLIYKTDMAFYKPQYDSGYHLNESITSIIKGYKTVSCFAGWKSPQERYAIQYLIGYCLENKMFEAAGELSRILNIVESLKKEDGNYINITTFYQEKAENQFKISQKLDTIKIYSDLVSEYIYRLGAIKYILFQTSTELDREKQMLEGIRNEKRIISDSIGTIKQLNFKLDSTNSELNTRNGLLKITNDKLETSNLYLTIALWGVGLLFIGFFSLSILVYRNNRVIKNQKEEVESKNKEISTLHTLSSYREMVWQEIAHTPIDLISKVHKSLSNKDVAIELLKPLDVLYEFLRDLFDSIGKTKLEHQSDLTKEIRIAEKYVDCNNFTESIPIEFKFPPSLENKKIPPAIIVSTVKNAIDHAFNKIGKSFERKIEISIEENNDGTYFCNILDNGDGFDPSIKKIEDIPEGSTGLVRANNVLDIFNSVNKEKTNIAILHNPLPDWSTAVKLTIG